MQASEQRAGLPTENLPLKPPVRKPVFRLGMLLREKWPEYIVEIVVIILGITLSFALEEWKDQQEKRHKEQAYLRELQGDLQTDQAQLGEIIGQTRQILQRATELIQICGQPKALFPADSLAAQLRFLMQRPRFVAENATFADLTGTGNMQLLRQAELRRSLFDYYRNYHSVFLVETAELEAANNLLGPYLIKLPLFDAATAHHQARWQQAGQAPELLNVVHIRKSMREELLRDYQDLLAQTLRLQQLLRQQIH
jgi:type II secretory pathway pseudopilin PulG